jgi:very-short-patch-repair endonuclease
MNRKMSQDEFKARASKLHNNKYDYSKVEYKGSNKKIIIICPIENHGEFEQQAGNHINRVSPSGCTKCHHEYTANKQRTPLDDFISKCREIHGDAYKYDAVEYVNAHTEIIIKCKIHEPFKCSPYDHKNRKRGCPQCKLEKPNPNTQTTEKFIAKATKKHGNLFDYSQVVYQGYDKQITIVCPIEHHGAFVQTPKYHLDGGGCPKCGRIRMGDVRRLTLDEFLQKAREVHGDTYDYRDVRYENGSDPVKIICQIHGAFEQLPNSHINAGAGCPQCGFIKRATANTSTREEFIERATLLHQGIYDYSKVEYTLAKELVIIKCKNHGEFTQTPYCHLQGQGCPDCIHKSEGKLSQWLEKYGFQFRRQATFDWCIGESGRYLRFDFYLESLNLIIELDGGQHFKQVSNWKSPEEIRKVDKFKMDAAVSHGISVVRIYQPDVWDDKNEWESELTNALDNYDTPEIIFIGEIYASIKYV